MVLKFPDRVALVGPFFFSRETLRNLKFEINRETLVRT